MNITLEQAAQLIKSHDNFRILLHRFPDGDTIGCGYSLCAALQSLGKKAVVMCSDKVSGRFGFITGIVQEQQFEPQYTVSVDVADSKLLGELNELYGDKVDLCIDHHPSNSGFAKNTFVDADASAACEIVYKLIGLIGAQVTADIAAALYTGIATDTGCFKFSNTTANTHIIAAELIKKGIDYAEINRVMFDTKSKSRVLVERRALDSVEFHCDDKIAIMTVSRSMIDEAGADDSELDGITSLPRQIEGVIIGITLREMRNGKFKVSVRTHAPISASELCSNFGGGGHERAAGCQIDDTYENAKQQLLKAAEDMLCANKAE